MKKDKQQSDIKELINSRRKNNSKKKTREVKAVNVLPKKKTVLSKILLLVVIAFAIFTFAFFMNQEREYKKQKTLYSQNQEVLESVKQLNESLEKQKTNIDSEEEIEKLAHEQGLIRKGEIVFEDGVK